jgi:hypothetical protein
MRETDTLLRGRDTKEDKVVCDLDVGLDCWLYWFLLW